VVGTYQDDVMLNSQANICALLSYAWLKASGKQAGRPASKQAGSRQAGRQ